MHPTLLPRHRGRAPIPWTILTGLARTGVTLFEIIDPTADSGPDRRPGRGADRTRRDGDDALRFPRRRAPRAHPLVRAADRSPERRRAVPQDPRRASSWPKRTPPDGIIDWETRAPYLHDWVRAQTRPYPGAFTWLGDDEGRDLARPAGVARSARARPGRSSSSDPRGRSSPAGTARSSSRSSRRAARSKSGRCSDERGCSCSRPTRTTRCSGWAARSPSTPPSAATRSAIVCVTDGSSTQYPGDAGDQRAQGRRGPRAAAELGVTDYVHLDLPDMRLDTLPHVEVNRVVEEQVARLPTRGRLHACTPT